MQTQKIEFYKLRDFGAKINALVEFLRENLGRLFLVLLLIGGPAALLLSLLLRNFFTTVFDFETMQSGNPGDVFALLGGNYFLLLLISFLVITLIVSVTYTYMRLYNAGIAKETSLGDVLRQSLSKYGGLILLGILSFIVIVAGVFFFILPGIYFAVVLSIAYPIYAFEDISVGGAFGRAFTLIRGKWWSTFGLIFVTSLIANIVQIIFSVPFLIVYFMNIFTLVEEVQNDPNSMESFSNLFTSGYMTVSMAISTIGSYLTYSIPLIALGYQYSNLVERNEGKGLMDEIESFDKEE